MIELNKTSSQILDEFWKDYRDVIRVRLFSWINHHKKEIIRAPKKRIDKDGYVDIPEIRKINTDTGNKYRCAIKAGFTKQGLPKFVTTTYMIFDNKTALILPMDGHDYVIILEKKFFERYIVLYKLNELPINDVIDSFMKQEKDYYLTCRDTGNKDYNAEVRFTIGELFGIGSCEDNKIRIKTLITKSELNEWKEAYKLKDDLSPVEIYIKNKERNKIFSTIYYNPEDQKKKQQQINDAWDLYERGKI